MSALTYDDIPDSIRDSTLYRGPIKNGVKVFYGSWLAEDANGFLLPFDGTAGQYLIGMCNYGENGKASGTASVPPYLGLGDTSQTPNPAAGCLCNEFVLPNVSVVGASAASDRGLPVYLAGDDHTLTLVRPTATVPVQVGEVLSWGSTTYCDVLIYALSGRRAPSSTTLLFLGRFDAASIVNGNARTAFPAPYHGKIKSLFAMVDTAIAGVGGTADVNLEINGTNVTGGVVTVSTVAGTRGAKLDGTAITAANEIHTGDLIDVETSGVSAMSGGTFDLYANVELLAGA